MTLVKVGNLSGNVLLKIFRYYIDASPRFWLRLAHVCRIWRRIILVSPLELRLQLFCTHGTPVSKILDFWLTLPIVAGYGGSLALDPPAPEDENNIMAALKQSDRVITIFLSALPRQVRSLKGYLQSRGRFRI